MKNTAEFYYKKKTQYLNLQNWNTTLLNENYVKFKLKKNLVFVDYKKKAKTVIPSRIYICNIIRLRWSIVNSANQKQIEVKNNGHFVFASITR